MQDMKDIVSVAWSAKKLRNQSVRQTTDQVAKSFELNQEEKDILEMCLIELTLGISKMRSVPEEPEPTKVLELYRNAVLSEKSYDLGISGEECSARLAEKVLGLHMVHQMM